jgi:hypothetical protein
MKRVSLILLGILISSLTFAQEKNDEYRTIFGTEKVKFGGMGVFEMNFSSLGGDFAYGTGGGGGVILNKSIFLGGYGMGNYINRDVTLDSVAYTSVNFGHGGFWLGYILKGNYAIHPFIGMKLGWGGISQQYDHHDHMMEDNAFVITPSVEMEFNIARYFRIAVGGHYQVVTGLSNKDGLSNSDFSGPGANLSFRFGWF